MSDMDAVVRAVDRALAAERREDARAAAEAAKAAAPTVPAVSIPGPIGVFAKFGAELSPVPVQINRAAVPFGTL